jgi:hypothetical protein
MKSIMVEMNVGSEDVDKRAKRLFDAELKADMKKIMNDTLVGVGEETKGALLYLFEKAFVYGHMRGFTHGVVCGISAEVIDCQMTNGNSTKH